MGLSLALTKSPFLLVSGRNTQSSHGTSVWTGEREWENS
jgi:hypothetical protein